MSPASRRDGPRRAATRERPARRERPKKRELEVIATAARIFHERGYSETSVEDIANALGILKGSLYYYIRSKEHLLSTIVTQVHADVTRLLDESLSRTDLTPLGRLARYIRSQTEYNAENVTTIAVYYDDLPQLSADRLDEIRRERRAMGRQVTELVRQAQAAGEIDPAADPAVASYCIFATVNWIYRWYRPGGRIAPSALADQVLQYALHGAIGAGRTAPHGG